MENGAQTDVTNSAQICREHPWERPWSLWARKTRPVTQKYPLRAISPALYGTLVAPLGLAKKLQPFSKTKLEVTKNAKTNVTTCKQKTVASLREAQYDEILCFV